MTEEVRCHMPVIALVSVLNDAIGCEEEARISVADGQSDLAELIKSQPSFSRAAVLLYDVSRSSLFWIFFFETVLSATLQTNDNNTSILKCPKHILNLYHHLLVYSRLYLAMVKVGRCPTRSRRLERREERAAKAAEAVRLVQSLSYATCLQSVLSRGDLSCNNKRRKMRIRPRARKCGGIYKPIEVLDYPSPPSSPPSGSAETLEHRHYEEAL